MRYFLLFAITALTCTTCNNLEDASPADRSTFVKFFEGPYDLTASSIELIPGGYVILANERIILADTAYLQTVLIELDEQGNRIGDFHPFSGGTGKSFKPLIANGAVTGYIIVGDSIYTDLQAEQAANVTISSMRVLELDNAFQLLPNGKKYITDRLPISPAHPVKDDFFGGSVNLTDDGVIFLGTFKEGVTNQQNAPEQQLLFALDANLDSAWFKTYPLLGDTFVNSKSVHYLNGKIIWATAVADVQGDFTFSYVTIPFVQEQSEHENNSGIGLTSIQLFLPSDIQPASSSAFGYGVIGTYSEQTDGSKGNIFFLRVDINGNIITGSDRYFDGIESFTNELSAIDKNTSSIVDNGEAITSTNDGGFVLAGTFSTNPEKGKGGKDLFLIKLNATGNVVWMKTFGGSGDEVPVGIRETEDGSLVVCGTNTLGDYASVFLMKMDKNGELKN